MVRNRLRLEPGEKAGPDLFMGKEEGSGSETLVEIYFNI